MPGVEGAGRAGGEGDLELTPKDREVLLEALTKGFPANIDADLVLDRLGFPRWRAPNFETGPRAAWLEVFKDLDRGIVADPYRALLSATQSARPWQTDLNALYAKGGVAHHALLPPDPPEPGQPLPSGAAEHPTRPVVEVMGVDRHRAGGFALKNLETLTAVQHMGYVIARASTGPGDRNGDQRPDVLHVCAELVGRDLVFGESGRRVGVPVAELADQLAGPRMFGVLLNFSRSAEVADEFLRVARTVVAHHGHLDQHCALEFVLQTYALVPRDRCMGLAARGAANLLAHHPNHYCPGIQDNLVVRGEEGAPGAGETERRHDHEPATRRIRPSEPTADIRLSPVEMDAVRVAVGAAFRSTDIVRGLLVRMGFTEQQLGTVPIDDPSARWEVVFLRLDSGLIEMPYRTLLAQALGCYPYNRVLLPLAEKYGVQPGPRW